MQHMSYTVFESDPWRDECRTIMVTRHVRLEALSVRSRAAHQQGTRSQDFIHVASSESRREIAFCVCDGVGSSFAGHIAAQYLARRLPAALLDASSPADLDTQPVLGALQTWAREAAAEVAAVEVPFDTAALVRDVLEDTRRTRGSETVFLAGHLAWILGERSAALDKPSGVDVRIVAMGNVRGLMLNDTVPQQAINAQGVDSDRWAIDRGPVGALTVQHFHLPQCNRIQVYTDGVETLNGHTDNWSCARLTRQAVDLRSSTDTDDIAMLDIWYQHSSGDSDQEK